MLSFTPYLAVRLCRAMITTTKGTSSATADQRPAEKYAMSTAAARKIQGADLVMAAPNGASSTANSTASGTATKAATMAPDTILRKAMCGTPSLRSMFASCSRGVAMVSPGIPNSAVGTACVMCLATAPARKKVKTPAGGTPSSTTSKVSGASVVVSSVPDTRPMAANTTAPSRPMAAATMICSSRMGSLMPAPPWMRLAAGRRPVVLWPAVSGAPLRTGRKGPVP
ncbi:hypothetical protein D3C73_989440 [compost metagenome]